MLYVEIICVLESPYSMKKITKQHLIHNTNATVYLHHRLVYAKLPAKYTENYNLGRKFIRYRSKVIELVNLNILTDDELFDHD